MPFPISIRSKLFLAIFLAGAVSVTAAAALFHYRIQQAFTHYIHTLDETIVANSVEVLEQYYDQHSNWGGLTERRAWRRLLVAGNRQTIRQPPPQPAEARVRLERSPPSGRRIFGRIVLFDQDKNHLQGRFRNHLPILLEPLRQQEEIVGYLGMYQRREFNDDSNDARFVNAQRKTLLMVALLTLLISSLIAWLLSRQLVKPIQSLRRSSNELAHGNYATRIQVHNSDELGLLSQDFNKLAESLQQHEKSRQQWLMDIAHELRTPLSILRGEIEAIQDGISTATPNTIQSLHQETLHLQRLVDDLYTLSMSDNGSLSYRREMLNFTELVEETLAQFESQVKANGLVLHSNIPPIAIAFNGDRQRLQQLLQNLLKNSLRYTDAPGKLSISLRTDIDRSTTNIGKHNGKHNDTNNIVLTINDSAPGVPNTALPQLFERLYRVESSRNRATGGAGIGLSICHNIVQAHGGTITAGHSPYGGLAITIILPNTKQ